MNRINDRLRVACAATVLLAALDASATVITFDNLAVGTLLSTQYAGVVFSPNAFTGAGGPNGPWATNTDMTVVSSTGSDVGVLGTPSLVSGNMLRSFAAWLGENGDPSFRVSFASAISSFSAVFAAVTTFADVRLFAYDGSNLLGTVAGSSTGQFVLSFSAPHITSVVVTPGDFFDYVGVDNINYQTAVTAVPEAGTLALMSAGLIALGWVRRREIATRRRSP